MRWSSRPLALAAFGVLLTTVSAGAFRKIAFLTIIALLSPFQTAVPAIAQQDILADLHVDEKLHAPADILADFVKGEPETAVIVILRPTAAAMDLAVRSRASAHLPAEFTRPGAATYYNLQDESVRSQLQATVKETVSRVVEELGATGIKVTQRFSYQFGFAARVSPAALARIVKSPDVVAVEKDSILQAQLAQGIPLMNATTVRGTYTGSGLSIAICDTGIDTSHPRLGGSATFPNAKVIGGYDVGDNDADPRPGSTGEAHGTACAGIAAGSTGTVGDYIGGVAPDAKLYAVKISYGTNGYAWTSAMIAGWEWCVTHKNDDPANPILIISTSFGGGWYNSTCDAAVSGMTTAAANAVAAGITIFASSGNGGLCDSTGWPACISYVNSVGAVYDANFGTYYPCLSSGSCAIMTSTTGCYYATDNTLPDKVTSYSNSASFLTLFAPSNQAATLDIVGSGGYDPGDYDTTFGGTSAASPYAAGSAAVLQSAAKTLTGSYLTPAEVRSYLAGTGDNVTDGKIAITKPRINLGRAVFAIASSLPIVAITPNDAMATEAGPTTGQFTASRTGPTTAALTVNFAVAGTATPGSDYTGVGSSVTIPAGAASATITVTPVDDAALEDQETVIVTLSAAATYWLGAPGATLTIHDNDGPVLADAMDTTLTMTSGGDTSWAAQMATTHDGVDAVQSGTVGNGQSSWLQTTATGASVSFWWRVSSESDHDFLRFSVDGVEQAAISGEVAWQQRTFALAAGSHTLKWEYSKDGALSAGTDRGWVDQLVVSTTMVTVTASEATATETGPTTGEFTVTRTGETAAALTVDFAVTGTATPGSDYAGIGSSVTIPAGAASATLPVTSVDDSIEEGDETVVLTLLSGGCMVGSPASATVTIQDNDDRPLAEALDTALTMTSGGAASWWGQTATTHDGVDAAQSGMVERGQSSWMQTTATGAGVSFWWKVSSATSWDFLRFYIDGIFQGSIDGEVAWQQKTFAIAAGSHTLRWEYTKNTWSPTGGADRGWVDQLEVSATTPPTATVTASDATATESGPTTGEFTVSRTGDTSAALAVDFVVTGTATPGSDYIDIGTSVTIPAGSASATVSVMPVDDAVVEGDETVVLSLAGYVVGNPARALVTIQDNDDLPLAEALDMALTVTSQGYASWFGQAATTHDGVDAAQSGTVEYLQSSGMQVTATGAGVSFWWRVSSKRGWDYLRFFIDGVGQAMISGEVAWEQKTFAMAAGSHTLKWEYSKNWQVSVGSDRGWIDQLVVSATTPPTVTVTANDPTATETGPTTGQFTVIRTGDTTAALTVNFSVTGTATSGSDFTGIGTSVTIPAGSASTTITATPIDDTTVENDESVIVTLSANAAYIVGSPASATVTITSDDLPMVTIAADDTTATEIGASNGRFTVTRTGSTTAALTVNFAVTGTAASGSDYHGIGTSVTIPGGYASATISVMPIDDADIESDETVIVTLSANAAYIVGSPASATVTITSDDVWESVKNDFDGDGRSDIGCYYPPGGNWYAFNSGNGFWQTQFGYAGTIPITGDFDGDGKSDIGCYHPPSGNWYVMKSTEGFWQTQFGYAGTIPITGDFDGDGKSDIGCYHPSSGNWYVMKSNEGFWQTQFGYAGTIPITGDFDGDGKSDIGCYHPSSGNWYVMKSTEGFWQTQFGYEGTIPITGDFDGDGRDDFGCYHPPSGNWHLMKSNEGFWLTQFGYAGTEPVVGDFDGDGKSDLGCYYPAGGKWYVMKSTEGFWQTQFGYGGTIPLGGTLR